MTDVKEEGKAGCDCVKKENVDKSPEEDGRDLTNTIDTIEKQLQKLVHEQVHLKKDTLA